MKKTDILIPANVPKASQKRYVNNYHLMTQGTGRMMLFAGDQKIEHLNDDFYGHITVDGKKERIAIEDANPEHLFKIATQARIGCFATQLGMVAHYGKSYPNIPYLIKLNSKSHLVKTGQLDPMSNALWDVQQVVDFQRQTKLRIVGVGYTLYLGSEFEEKMLREAAQIINEAHKHGLVVVLWMYPRGVAVKDERDAHLIAGAAGVACCLGADFVKVSYPSTGAEAMREAVHAAGRTKVVTAGGSSKGIRAFLQQTWDQINIAGCGGNATGRNIHQKPLADAVRLANAIAAITFDGKSVDEAMKVHG